MYKLNRDCQTLENDLKQQIGQLNIALAQTPANDNKRRTNIENQINEYTKLIKDCNTVELDTLNTSVNNLNNAKTVYGMQLGTLGVLDNQIDNMTYNVGVLKQDDINKARMVDLNINEGKEYDDQMELFKMISFYLVFILFFGILGKFIPGISNITKIICLIITLILIFHVIQKMRDMYSRSSTNYDEYNFKKPSHNNFDDKSQAFGWKSYDTDDDDSKKCTTDDDILNHSVKTESFTGIKAYNQNNNSAFNTYTF